MASKIGKPIGPAARKPRKRRRLTPEGRRRMAKAGARNLKAYKARVATLKAQANEDVGKLVESFGRELLADLGEEVGAAQRALVESAKASYTAILLALRQLELAPGRLVRAKGLSAALAAHTNGLARTLRLLGIRRRGQEAPTLEQVFEQIEKEKLNAKN